MEESISDPLDISNETELVREAQTEISNLDIIICGTCTEVFHFMEEFKQHKAKGNCTEQPKIKCENSDKPQIWAYLLWKGSYTKTLREKNEEVPTSWILYQRWSKLLPAEKDLWLVAGQTLQNNKKIASAKTEKVISEIKMEKDPLALDDSNMENINTQTKNSANENNKAVKNFNPKEEFVVEKILSRRFNPQRRIWEYEIKWKNYEETTFEPLEHLDNCKKLMDEFEMRLRKEKTLTPRGRGRPRVNPLSPTQTKTTIVKKAIIPTPQVTISPIITSPGGRPQRSSKQKALSQVKAWCGNNSDDEGTSGKRAYDDGDDSDDSFDKKMRLDAESEDTEDEIEEPPKKIAKIIHTYNNGIGKTKLPDNVLIPDAKGVVRISQKQLPSLSSGVYIMSKSSGIIKLDAAASKIATCGGQAIVKVNPKPGGVGQTQVKIIRKDDLAGIKSRLIPLKLQDSSTTASIMSPNATSATLKAPITKIIKHVVSKVTSESASSNTTTPTTSKTITPLTAKITTPTTSKTITPTTSKTITPTTSKTTTPTTTKTTTPTTLKTPTIPSIIRKPGTNVDKKGTSSRVVVKKKEQKFSISNKNDDSDDGLEEMEFPTDLPLPEPDSPPGDFILDPITGKIVGQDDGNELKDDVKSQNGTETLDNIVKLAAADITEDDLKPDIAQTAITTTTTVGNSNVNSVNTLLLSTAATTTTTTTSSTTVKSTSVKNEIKPTFVTAAQKTETTSVVNYKTTKMSQSILNTAMANSNILQKTLQSPRPKLTMVQQQRVLNQTVATKQKTTFTPLIRSAKPTNPSATVPLRPKFNISSSGNVRNVYSKSNNNIKRSPSTTTTTPTNVYRAQTVVKTPIKSNVITKVKAPPPPIRQNVISTSTKVNPTSKAVINMPSLSMEDELTTQSLPVKNIQKSPIVQQQKDTKSSPVKSTVMVTSPSSSTATLTDPTTTTTATATTTTELTESDLAAFTMADGDRPVYITGDDGTIYQVAGQNEEGQTILLTQDSNGQQQCLLVTNEIASEEIQQQAQSQQQQQQQNLNNEQNTVQEPLEIATDEQPVVAQFVRTEPPSPGGTPRIVVMLPNGECIITEVTPEQYESLEVGK